MIAFYLSAAALVAAALVLLLRPWWRQRRRTASADSQTALNVVIHRDRMAEIERDHLNGTLATPDLAEARDELQRQLLEDTAAADTVTGGPGDRRVGVALAVLLPVLAVALYALLGSPSAILPETERTQKAAADMEQLTIRLAQKLEQSPDNPEGWAMLARSYKSLGRWDDAERAFGRIGPSLEKNAELLAEYAEMLAQRDNGFGERARALIRKALELDPRNMLALFLGGGEAFESGRYAEAATLWERLLPQLEAGSEDAQLVAASLARARERSGGGGGSRVMSAAPQDEVHRGVAKPGASANPAKPATNAVATSLSGRVELAAALKAKANPDDVVFIFARAVDGPRMPLAAKRARVADLPLDFVLDDSQAVMPGANLSSAQQVRVEVRISKSGTATPGTGDLTGKSEAVKPGAKGLRLVIDRVEP
jgi:cytochrome c-type biogenesis protein CcmH